MKKHVFVWVLTLLFSSFVHAEDLLSEYILNLFGYRIGMSYDEAINLRAFHSTAYLGEQESIGTFDSIYIDETAFKTEVYFNEGRIFKIIGRFDPASIKNVAETMSKSLGKAENSSKTMIAADTSEIEVTHLRWFFPGARIDLVSASNNMQFATISMLASADIPSTSTTPDKEGR